MHFLPPGPTSSLIVTRNQPMKALTDVVVLAWRTESHTYLQLSLLPCLVLPQLWGSSDWCGHLHCGLLPPGKAGVAAGRGAGASGAALAEKAAVTSI